MPFILAGLVLVGSAYAALRIKRTSKRLSTANPSQPATNPQLIKKPTNNENRPISAEQRHAIRQVKLLTVAVAFAFGGLVYPLLNIASVLCFIGPIIGFYHKAWIALSKERRIESNVSYAVYFTLAFISGSFVALALGAWFFMLTNWLVTKTEDHSRREIVDLFGQEIRTVWRRLDSGAEIEVPINEVKVGDLVVVDAGQMIPMDGIVVDGLATVDQHRLTGEAQPVEKWLGDPVFAATVVRSGRLCLKIEKTGDETMAAQIGAILTNTEDFKANLQSRTTVLNDRVAMPFLGLTGVALMTLGVDRALAVLLGTPGFRMLFYAPLSMLSHLRLGAEQQILIKDGRSLELLGDIDTIVFDKTGTLTVEQPYVSAIHTYSNWAEEDVLRLAAAAERTQEHPIARAILQAANEHGIDPAMVDDASYEIGYGLKVRIDSQTVRIGSLRFLTAENVTIPDDVEARQMEAHEQGCSLVLVGVDNDLAGIIVLTPTIRAETESIIAALRNRGLRLFIMSGDHEAPTRRLAERLGLDGYFAEVLPEGKAELVERLQAEGRGICFVGDGINDAIALKRAQVSVSLAGATNLATDTAQIVLMDKSLSRLPELFELADSFKHSMRTNQMLATVPNLIIVGGAFFLGWGFMTCTLLLQLPMPLAVYNAVRPQLKPRRGDLTTPTLSIQSEKP